MSDPSSALSVWQLTLMAVVPTVLLVGWLITVFIAAREPRVRDVAAAALPAVTPILTALGQDEPAPPDRRLAA